MRLKLVDLTPDELLQRLAEGKVYTPERSREAIENFFRKGNITALREMALRIVADRVDRQLHDYMQHKRIRGPWKSGTHLLVAIDYQPNPQDCSGGQKTFPIPWGRTSRRYMSRHYISFHRKSANSLIKILNLPAKLGIRFRIITNYDVVKAIVEFAQKENVTHIIVGKPRVRNIFSMFRLGNFVSRLVRYSGNIDVYILGSDNQAKD